MPTRGNFRLLRRGRGVLLMQIADCVWDLEIREAAIDMSSYCNPQAAVIGSDRDAYLDNVKQEPFTKLNHALSSGSVRRWESKS